MSLLMRDPMMARMACMFMRHGEKTKSMALIEEAVVELRRRHGVERYVRRRRCRGFFLSLFFF